ncbi:UDP-N-acetylmuramate--L-alanine ligase [Candidatus Dependentiae bacterium]|nr:UDP-N-acetylmuramate--L-alanine ligase [Candidatus Dependentiae bacterium]MCC7414879.1 UDP-N-acetylmuramate--L-alanine ligase [Campylobacterota bacterium]
MYKKKAHIHFVGIGGIGMSGIATILRNQDYSISGCDLDLEQKSIHDLQALGCSIFQGNNTPHCQNSKIDILVYSSAIKAQDPEIIAAQKRGIPTIGRALMLAELMRTKYSIAIAGSHGKTTTTSLISHCLLEANMDPTVVIGGHLHAISSNARLGKGDFLVAEADESDRSFLHLQATIAIVTNIDLEHLETYTDIDDIKSTFRQFLNNIPFYGRAILCVDDEHVRSLLPMPHLKIISYGIENKSADIQAQAIDLRPDHTLFTVWSEQEQRSLGNVRLAMPGMHNVLNALAAIALAQDLGISFATTSRALESFKGVDRRFSYRGTYKTSLIFDDYGHHPNEIRQTLLVARRRTRGKLMVVFQPHRYSRTHALWDDFVNTLLAHPLDELILTDIYAASEAPIAEITSENLVKALRMRNPAFNITYVPFERLLPHIQHTATDFTDHENLILFLGAGKITKLSTALAKLSENA